MVEVCAYQFSPPAKNVHNMQSELFTVYNCLISKWSLVYFFWSEFLANGGLKKKREAVRSPKSGEVFNLRRENHMYGQG